MVIALNKVILPKKCNARRLSVPPTNVFEKPWQVKTLAILEAKALFLLPVTSRVNVQG